MVVAATSGWPWKNPFWLGATVSGYEKGASWQQRRGPGRQKQIESPPWDMWGQSAQCCSSVRSSVAALHIHWSSTRAFLTKMCKLSTQTAMSGCLLKCRQVQVSQAFQWLPFMCSAGLEGPRNLFVLGNHSTPDLYPCPHRSLCY